MFYFFSLKKCRNVCSFQRKTTVLETLISTLKTHVQLQKDFGISLPSSLRYLSRKSLPPGCWLYNSATVNISNFPRLNFIIFKKKTLPIQNVVNFPIVGKLLSIYYIQITRSCFNTATANIYFFPPFRILYSKRNSSYSICCLFLFELLKNLCVSALLVRIFTEKQVVFMTKYAIIVQLSVSLISFVHIFKFQKIFPSYFKYVINFF